MEKERTRKVRSDKRIEVKPSVELSLYNAVSRISYITNTPIKDVGERICVDGLLSRKVIELLSKNFRRSYQFQNTTFMGNPSLFPERTRKRKCVTKRASIRFSQAHYEQLSQLAYSLDTTISTAASILIEAAIRDTNIIDAYMGRYISEALDPERRKQLKMVLEFIRKDNPYDEDEFTLSRLLSFIMEEVKDQTHNLKQAVSDWLDKVTGDD